MIPDERPHRVPRTARRRAACLAAALAVLLPALAIQGCDKVALVAPTGTTITLYTNAQFLPVNGSAEVTASVIEANGYPVQNGTTVTFTTSLGAVEPSEAKTQDGKATVKLLAGTVSGTAEVNAFSGSSAAKATVKLMIGAAAVGQVLVSASPPTVPATGGTVQIVAIVQDTGGNGLSGVPVNFTTDFGTLSPDTAISDASGHARATLNTSQSATVTATAGAKNATAKVTALAVPTVTITPPSTTPSVGVPAAFTINVAAGANSSPITNVTVDFGEGGPIALGAVNGSVTVTHTFTRARTYTVTVTARDASGATTTSSIPVDVFAAVPFTLEVSASSGRINSPITITATPPVGAPAISTYEWNVGSPVVGDTDGVIITTRPTLTVVYPAMPCSSPSCVVQITVTATGVDGRLGFGSTTTTITP